MCWGLSWISFPREIVPFRGQTELGSSKVAFVDVSECLSEVDKLSSREQFWGPRNEPIPEDLRFPQWGEMKFIEPEFVDDN